MLRDLLHIRDLERALIELGNPDLCVWKGLFANRCAADTHAREKNNVGFHSGPVVSRVEIESVKYVSEDRAALVFALMN